MCPITCSVDGEFGPELMLDVVFDSGLDREDVPQGSELFGVLAAGVEVVGGVFDLGCCSGVALGPLVPGVEGVEPVGEVVDGVWFAGELFEELVVALLFMEVSDLAGDLVDRPPRAGGSGESGGALGVGPGEVVFGYGERGAQDRPVASSRCAEFVSEDVAAVACRYPGLFGAGDRLFERFGGVAGFPVAVFGVGQCLFEIDGPLDVFCVPADHRLESFDGGLSEWFETSPGPDTSAAAVAVGVVGVGVGGLVRRGCGVGWSRGCRRGRC